MKKLLVLVLLCASGNAHALELLPWQQWAGSSATVNLQIVPGAGDFTGDGKLDVVVYKPTVRKLWVGRQTATGNGFAFCAAGGSTCVGSNTEAWATLPTSCSQGFQFYSGQFGGSSRPDVVVYNPCAGDVRVLVNQGTNFGLTDRWRP